MSNYYADMAHVIRVVESCKTKGQFKIAQKMSKAFMRKWPRRNTTRTKRETVRMLFGSEPSWWDDEMFVALDNKDRYLKSERKP